MFNERCVYGLKTTGVQILTPHISSFGLVSFVSRQYTHKLKMSLTFDRPVGAVADARELEYVAALHQSHDVYDDHWFDASIRGTIWVHRILI